MSFVSIETPRLLLRPLQLSDMDVYYERIYGDDEVMRYLPAGKAISRERFESRIPPFMMEPWNTRGFAPWVVINKADQEFIGHCGLNPWPNSDDIEVLYAFAKPWWGQGFASEAAKASVDYGFAQLGLSKIIAAAHIKNIASQRVIEKLGMQLQYEQEWSGMPLKMYALTRP
ncbi:MAG: GNAT family N-acetyltransferase [Caldilineaceae bacterium]